MRCVGGTRRFVDWPVEIGRHEYRFVVDGRMVDDPRAKEFVPAARGERNALLRVVRPPSRNLLASGGSSRPMKCPGALQEQS